MDVTAQGHFLGFFCELPDPRGVNKIHKLLDMIVIAILAVICGADGWSEVALFGRCKQKWLAMFLELPGGIPSHDTFGRVFALLDSDGFDRCFLAWMSSLVELSGGRLLAIDGKSIRRSSDPASHGQRVGQSGRQSRGVRTDCGGGQKQRDHRHPQTA